MAQPHNAHTRRRNCSGTFRHDRNTYSGSHKRKNCLEVVSLLKSGPDGSVIVDPGLPVDDGGVVTK